MTEKQKLFADEYLKDLNATRAYRDVYRNVKNEHVARSAGNRLLTKADVRAYIDEKLAEIHSEKTADVKEVMEYLTAVMRGDTSSNVLSLCGNGCQKVIGKPPDEKERLKAAELIGKRYGMFTDRVDMDITVPIFEGSDDLED